MKRFIAFLFSITFLFSASAFADDLSGMTDAELYALHQDVLDEMMRRGLPEEPERGNDIPDIAERLVSFFQYWSVNEPDEMLALCDSSWKAGLEEPRSELFRILANRTPMDFTMEAVDLIAGEGPENLAYYRVTAVSHLDWNNGTACEKYRIRLLVRKEEDGLWHIDPTGLENCEKAEEDIQAEAEEAESYADAAAADTVLFYQPSGGEYYHLDPNCKSVNPRFLPLQGSFLFSELNDKPYSDLKPCEICGAP